MKKNILAIIVQTAVLFFCLSCEDEKQFKDMVPSTIGYSLTVQDNDLVFKTSFEHSVSLTVNKGDRHNTPWRFENIPEWITVTPKSGSGSHDVKITVSKNSSVSDRKATITLCSAVPYWSYSKELTVSQISMSVAEYVDLGLSVKWATFNVGASSPEEYGDYFAWGETEPKSDYGWSTYKYCNGSSGTLTRYCNASDYGYSGYTDGKTVLDTEDDVANVNWGGSWRMPTMAEFEELSNTSNCTWTWTAMNGVKGYRVVSKKSGCEGNSIFLPSAGGRYDLGSDRIGTVGYYWSSSLNANDSNGARGLDFNSGRYYMGYDDRNGGRSVRPVCPVPVTGISLGKQSIEIQPGETETLTATVRYENGATSNTVTWTTSNSSVVTVDQTGKVTAVSVGTCSITAASGSFTATCTVTVKPIESEYVDLGLSVRWATFNVGAKKPEDYGDYFAWGETEPKSDYSWSTYKYCKGSYYSMTKYSTNSSYGYNGFTDNNSVLDPEDDAAHVNWGGDWRMPTKAEQDELRNTDNCTWTWTTMNGVNGYKVVSKKSGYAGNWIFLPAAGYRGGTALYRVGSYGYYWSSSLNTGSPGGAYCLYFGSGGVGWNNDSRDYGQSVRPVCP